MVACLPAEAALAIRATTWHALFSSRAYPPPLTPRSSFTEIVATLTTLSFLSPRPPSLTPLARALNTISAFACEAGRVDIYDAADALGYPHRWPDATSPADLIALLLAAAPNDPAVAELLAAAQILRDRAFRPRATHVYIGVRGVDPAVGEPTQYDAAWRTEFSSFAQRRDFGAVTSIASARTGAILRYEIVHEDRATTVLTPTPTVQRPLRSHSITYDSEKGVLEITTDCMEVVTPLATMAGRIFFQNARHFLDEKAVDLWKLQELGPDALKVPELAGKLTATAIGGTWHSGKSHAITPRGDDFFKALARYKIRIEGGRLDFVTLRATRPSSDGGPLQCDVALRPPHLLTVSEPELAPLLRELLDAAKITSPESRPADFFSRQPWIDFREAWIASEGEADFGKLVESGVLQANRANRDVVPPEHPHAGRTATAYPLYGTKYLARSADPTIAPFVVDQRDLVVYALQFGKLASVIAEALALEGAASDLDDDGVLFCGRRTLGPTYFLLSLLTRPIRPATVERLREAAGHGHAVLVVPEGRIVQNGLRQIAMPKLAGPWEPLLATIIRALRLESFVDTTLYAPTDARVVLHRATMRVWIDGVLCAAIGENAFRLLEILVTHAGQLVHTKDIAQHIAKGKQTEDTTRRAFEALLDAIKKSVAAAKRKTPKDLAKLIAMPRHGQYMLTVKAFVD